MSATLPLRGVEHYTPIDAFEADNDNEVLVGNDTPEVDALSARRSQDQIVGVDEVCPISEREDARRKLVDAFAAIRGQAGAPVANQHTLEADSQGEQDGSTSAVVSRQNANSTSLPFNFCGASSRYSTSRATTSIEVAD